MFTKRCMHAVLTGFMLGAVVGLAGKPAVVEAAVLFGDSPQSSSASTTADWESPAQMHRAFLLSKNRGTLLIDQKGVEFRPGNGPVLSWPFMDIYAVSVAPHRLEIETYANRSLHRPGLQRYRFDLTQPMPAAVAGSLTKAVLRPSINTIPNLELSAVVSIPVHHRRPTGGTNGVLRFREEGIDYVTTASGDSRSWRWADIQTLSHPDPYHLFVFGYRDNYAFDLKEALSREVFNHVSDQIWSHNESRTTISPKPLPADAPKSGLTETR
jgi:hypothetical protein